MVIQIGREKSDFDQTYECFVFFAQLFLNEPKHVSSFNAYLKSKCFETMFMHSRKKKSLNMFEIVFLHLEKSKQKILRKNCICFKKADQIKAKLKKDFRANLPKKSCNSIAPGVSKNQRLVT